MNKQLLIVALLICIGAAAFTYFGEKDPKDLFESIDITDTIETFESIATSSLSEVKK